MGLDGIIDYLKAGKKCYDIVTETIPQKMQDGVLTVDEMAQVIKDICAVFHIRAEIKVPDNFKKTYFDIVEYDTFKSH